MLRWTLQIIASSHRIQVVLSEIIYAVKIDDSVEQGAHEEDPKMEKTIITKNEDKNFKNKSFYYGQQSAMDMDKICKIKSIMEHDI